MLSGCELIDIENISLPSKNMKFVGEWAKRTSHRLHILSSRLIFLSINHIYIQVDIFIILKSNIKMDIWHIYRFRYLYFHGKHHMIQYLRNNSWVFISILIGQIRYLNSQNELSADMPIYAYLTTGLDPKRLKDVILESSIITFRQNTLQNIVRK